MSSTATGRTKQHISKSSTANSKKRKSLATDPTLLQSESDEEEADQHGGRIASTATTVRHSSKSTTSVGSKTVKKASVALSTAARDPESRRSTRLSGEGVESDNSESRTQPSLKSKTKSTQSSKAVPAKRKEPHDPVIPVRTAIENTHPTPPLTDPDMEEAQELQRQSQIRSQSNKNGNSDVSKGKKTKTAAPQSSQSNSKHAKPSKPSRPARLPSDDGDDFTFVRMDTTAAPSASAPVEQPSNIQASTSTLPPPSSAPARTESTSAPKKSKTKATSSKKNIHETTSHSSAGLLESMQSTSTAQAPVQPARPTESQDRKGKRKAAEMDTSGSGTEANQARNKEKQKPDKKKGRANQLSQENSREEQIIEEPGTPQGHISIPMNSQETPAIRRNQAMRAGVGGPPGTPGTISRRSSGDIRGRRGSSIGNGFEALPHPSLPTNTLYRHIKADDPPAIRFRTLMTWSAHRLKEAMEAGSKGQSAELRQAASGVMEALIRDLAEKKIDLSWQEEPATENDSMKNLPPNPGNETNQAMLEACQAWTERLKAEDAARNARIKQYKVMTESISKLINVLPAPPPPPADGSAPVLPDVLHPNFTLPIPRMKSKDDVLAYGRALLQPKAAPVSRRKSVAPPPSAAEAEVDPDVIDVSAELPLPLSLDDIRHQAASMHQTAHRLDQFLKLSDTFLNQHLEKTQRALSHLTLRSTESGSSGGSDGGQKAGLHIAGAAGAGKARKGMSLTDMLRGISRADTAGKHSRK